MSLDRSPDLDGEFFPHTAQAIKLVRRRRSLTSEKRKTVTLHAITSLVREDRSQARHTRTA